MLFLWYDYLNSFNDYDLNIVASMIITNVVILSIYCVSSCTLSTLYQKCL